MRAFEALHPPYCGKIYFETLPPGILEKQLAAGGTISVGNMTWTVEPDAYFASLNAVKTLIEQGRLSGPPLASATNDLAIMVDEGNPLRIAGLADLVRPNLRLAMPNIQFEDVARQVQQSLVKAGGEALKTAVYDANVKDGSTLLTQIHHRQTPLYILQGKVDAGVTWKSEVVFQAQAGHAIGWVDIAAAHNTTDTYAGALVKGAAHQAAARDWLEFIASPGAQGIFKRCGLKPHVEVGTLR